MKVGNIVEPNSKGQIVIPKQIRDMLGINTKTPLNLVIRGGGIYIYPIDEVYTRFEGENIYSKILNKTRGAWRDDKTWDEFEEQRKELELENTKNNKKPW